MIAFIFKMIFFILAGNEDMRESLDEFEFRQYPTTYYGVSCPWASENQCIIYNVVNTLAPSFLIESSSFYAGKEDNYNISDEFEIWHDSTTYCGVSCP